MSYKSMLNIKNAVQIRRVTETSDGFGATTTTTALTTLSAAAIWEAGSGDSYLSEKIAAVSTHVLALLPAEYTFTDNDSQVYYDSKTYKITGHENDVMNLAKVKIIGLERIT